MPDLTKPDAKPSLVPGRGETKSNQARKRSTSETQSILRHWQVAAPDDRFAHLVRDASRSYRRSLQKRLAEFGVPFGLWAFLRVLWVGDGLTQKQLSDEAGVMEPTTFVAVKSMEKRRWIERRQAVDNRKNVYVFLTDAGRALREQLVPIAEYVDALATSDLTADEILVARRVLLAVITRLAQDMDS